MVELHNITSVGNGKFKFVYKYTRKDINNNDVELEYGTYVQSEAELLTQIQSLTAEKTNIESQIADMQKRIVELKKL